MLSNITLYGNWSGGWHANETTSITGTSNSTSLTKDLDNGSYIWNCLAYDNDSNFDWGDSNYTLIVDTTAPTVSFNCTPSSVNRGATVTCTCSASDSEAGVNTISYIANPPTSSAGSYSTTCTAIDNAGNSGNATASYTVTLSGGGNGGGGGSETFWLNTHIITNEQFSEGFTKSLEARQRVQVQVNNEDHYVGVKELTETSATIEILGDPIEIKLNVEEDVKVDVTNDGYYDIYVKLNSIVDNKANVLVKKLHEKISEEVKGPVETTEEIITDDKTKQGLSWLWIIVGVLILLIVGVIILIYKVYKTKNKFIKDDTSNVNNNYSNTSQTSRPYFFPFVHKSGIDNSTNHT
jgi:hypothetical protein